MFVNEGVKVGGRDLAVVFVFAISSSPAMQGEGGLTKPSIARDSHELERYRIGFMGWVGTWLIVVCNCYLVYAPQCRDVGWTPASMARCQAACCDCRDSHNGMIDKQHRGVSQLARRIDSQPLTSAGAPRLVQKNDAAQHQQQVPKLIGPVVPPTPLCSTAVSDTDSSSIRSIWSALTSWSPSAPADRIFRSEMRKQSRRAVGSSCHLFDSPTRTGTHPGVSNQPPHRFRAATRS